MILLEELAHLNRQLLRSRLEALGWRRLSKPGRYLDPNGRLFYVPEVLESPFDYSALRSVVEALLEVEHGLTLSDIQSRLEGKKEDVLLFGAEVVGAPPGRLPVRQSVPFYENATRYVRSLCEAVLAHRSYTGRQRESGFLDRLQYGQSLPSSYAVLIHVPIDTIAAPIGREFVRSAVASFMSLEAAVATDGTTDITESKTARWTPKTCEALLKFTETPAFTDLKMRASPDPIWPDELNNAVPEAEIVVPLVDAPTPTILAKSAAKLRGLSESQFVEVIGIPYASRDDTVIGEGDQRRMSVFWQRDNAAPMKVQAHLSQPAYERLLVAQSKRQVRMTGWLRQRGSRWILEVEGQPTLLDELPPPQPELQHLFTEENDSVGL